MSAIRRNFEQIWTQLRDQWTTRDDYIDRIQIKNLRGIKDLAVKFSFPVCVLAGANGCGKSTVLFALACVYRSNSTPLATTLTPTKLFPGFQSTDASLSDSHENAEIHVSYSENASMAQMVWRRGKSKWNLSFVGRKGGKQPERNVYLHTLSKLTNPSEVRSILQMSHHDCNTENVDSSLIRFAQSILGYNYARLACIRKKGGAKDLLVAIRETPDGNNSVHYSEFHMSSGERAVIRLSMQLSKLHDALVLIDEIDVGLHPYIQQLLMLELHRLAIRNNLQVICTSHSPVVLDSVPSEARVFLERTSDNVIHKQAFRDAIQKSLYGRSQEMLSFICEDAEAEAFLRGVFDHLGPEIDMSQNDILIGRDSGKDQFLAHQHTLGLFRKLSDVVFVLDGDGHEIKIQLESQHRETKVVCLPGREPPEFWCWTLLGKHPERYCDFFGLAQDAFQEKLMRIDRLFAAATDKSTAVVKNKLYALVEESSKTAPELFRYVGRMEAGTNQGDVHNLTAELADLVRNWRSDH
ncbi:MAG TPA: hypothetical protein DEB39_06145 [Planctomycetaceae bacterium]|nr:hypothetical protein [Planctomycetaceae bacterium]